MLPLDAPPTTCPARSTVGGGGLFNGSDLSYSGRPAHPFNSSNRYFRARQAGNIAFALVPNTPINVTSASQALYFDWFVDNPWPYWFVAQSMSLLANGSDTIVHAARVDLYDWDKLSPPGNLTQLSAALFDRWDAEAGAAHLGQVLSPEVVARAPVLASMATQAPLARYVGKRVVPAFRRARARAHGGWVAGTVARSEGGLISGTHPNYSIPHCPPPARRYSTNVYHLGWGIDNVMTVTCKPGVLDEYAVVPENDTQAAPPAAPANAQKP